MTHLQRASAATWIAMFLVFGGGCASSSGHAKFDGWQRGLEQYVSKEGHGDLNVLRTVNAESPIPMFNVLGGDEPEGSTDIAGLLLDRRQILDHVWYIFVVANVDDQKITSMRVAAVSPRPGVTVASGAKDFEWRVGPPDRNAFAAYQQSAARGSGLSPDPLIRWKTGADRFELSMSEAQAQVKHVASGAVWMLDLGASGGNSPRKKP